MKWIAVTLMAFALAGCSGGKGDEPPQTQSAPKLEVSPLATPPETARRTPIPDYTLEPPLAARNYVRWGLSQPLWRIIEARVVDRIVSYVLQTEHPAHVLRFHTTGFLHQYAFGERGRPMVVRLLDGRGRFAWAAGYDGVGRTWVRARARLAGCGPIWDTKGRKLPAPIGALDPQPCLVWRGKFPGTGQILR